MENIKTVIIDKDEVSRELISRYINKIEKLEVCSKFCDLAQNWEQIIEIAPNLVILDVSKESNAVFDNLNKLTKVLKNVKIVAVSYDTDSKTAIMALRAGAKEFLVKPLIEADFIQSVEKAKDMALGNINDDDKCKVITVFSNKGGIGKTSTAVNLAYELALATKEKVALIDLNFQMGDVTTFLDLEPKFNANYVIDNLDRIDEDFLLSSMEKYCETSLYVLADPPDLERSNNISKEQVAKLVNGLKNTFSYVIIDTTSSFDEKTVCALDNSDMILFVLAPNLPSIRNAQRCLEVFSKMGYEKDKIKLILNRYLENDEVKVEYIEKALEHEIYHKVPNNYFTIINAINKGVVVDEINHRSNIAKAFWELGAKLSDNYEYISQKPQNKEDDGFLSIFKKKEKK